ncbi:MAG: sodium-dependent transporter [Ruminococcaceae bacterium]|nr:sodium-dependent transporter [Oscillospiraceae bacterium]
MSDTRTSSNRENFKSRWGFILASIGSAVGMGNIWRFPIMVSRYGGLTYLIPYIIFVFLLSRTGVIEEFTLGRAAGAGPVGAFGMCTERRGNRNIGEAIGVLPVLGSLGLAIGYTVVMGWVFRYTFIACSGEMFAMQQNMDTIVGSFERIASAQGANIWIVLAIVVTFVIMVLGVSRGIEKVNKVLIPTLFCLFVVLAVYIALLPGAVNGYKYIFTLNPAGLADPNVWLYAFGQAFFSLSVAGNGSIIYGSYLGRSESIPTAARYVALFDLIAASLAAIVILPAMAAGGISCDTSGPGLMFIYLVNVLNGMPLGRIVGVVFFICVLFAGITSIINLYEVSVAFMQDRLFFKRLPATALILLFGGAIAICIQAITSEWMDIISIYICPLGALLAGIMFFWVCERDFAESHVNLGSEKKIGKWFYPLGKYVYCPLALLALIAGAVLDGIG